MANIKKAIEVKDGMTLDEINKLFKTISKSNIISGKNEISEFCHVEKFISDIPTLDFLGPLTSSRMNLLTGNQSSCKSTIILMAIAKIIKDIKTLGQIKKVLIIDAEESFDEEYAQALGVDLEYVTIVRREKVLEKVFELIANLSDTGFLACVVIDSVDALIPSKQDDNKWNNTMGSQAGALAMHLPNLYDKLCQHSVTSFWVKQARLKLDAYGAKGEVLSFSGGKAFRHFLDNIFIVKRMSNKDLNFTPIAIKAEKCRSPRLGLTLQIPLGACGIDKIRDLVTISRLVGLIKGSGWYTFDIDEKEHKIQGEENLIEYLRENKDIHDKLKKEFYDKYVNNNSLIISNAEKGRLNIEQLVVEYEDENENSIT